MVDNKNLSDFSITIKTLKDKINSKKIELSEILSDIIQREIEKFNYKSCRMY